MERLGAVNGFDDISKHQWFDEINWDEVYKKECYIHPYEPKKLKNKQKRINMNSLMPSNYGNINVQYKNKELLDLKDWDYLRVGLDGSGVANFDVKH